MKFTIKPLVIVLVSLLNFACEDPISVDVPGDINQLTIDAFLTNKTGSQTIRLTLTQSYFNNQFAQPALGAEVIVRDNLGQAFEFIDENQDGNYIWSPINEAESFGQIGHWYQLEVQYEGEVYQADSEIKRVPSIDSILYKKEIFSSNNNTIISSPIIEFFARDFPGRGDTYWIRSFINDIESQNTDLNLAFDAGIEEGSKADGIPFPRDSRRNIFRSSGGIVSGDQIRVEIWSVNRTTYDFLRGLRTQLNIPDVGLFSVPVSNIGTNIRNTNPNSDQKAVGFFSTSAVSSLSGEILDGDKTVIK